MTPTDTKYVRVDQLSEMIAIPVTTLYRMIATNQIPYYRLAPRTLVFSIAEIEQWMAERRSPVGGKGA